MWWLAIPVAAVLGAGIGWAIVGRSRAYRHGLIVGDSMVAAPVLTLALRELTGGTTWDNAAVSGRNSSEILAQMRSNYRPGYHDLVVVSAGGNDGGRELSWTQENIRQIVELARRGGSRVVLLTEPPFRGYAGVQDRPGAVARSEASRRWALWGGSGADAVVDLHDVLGAGSGTLQGQYDSGDHLHPNRAGRLAMARAIVQQGRIARLERAPQGEDQSGYAK